MGWHRLVSELSRGRRERDMCTVSSTFEVSIANRDTDTVQSKQFEEFGICFCEEVFKILFQWVSVEEGTENSLKYLVIPCRRRTRL